MEDDDRLIIEGYQEDGRKFRPSDWIERISGMLARYGPDHRLRYARNVRPCIINGEKCLVLERGLKTNDPESYAFIMEFARSNRLKVQVDRREKELPVERDRRDEPVGA